MKKKSKDTASPARRLTDEQIIKIRKGIGAAFAVFGLFTLIALISYLFTWKQDQSLILDPAMMDEGTHVSNIAGKVGFKWSVFLIYRMFGLGSFALLPWMIAVAVRFIAGGWHRSLGKTALQCLSGAFVASVVLAMTGILANAKDAFGAGLGGQCGAFVVNSCSNLFGPVMALVLTLLILVGWLFLSSRRFADWLNGVLSQSRPEPDSDPVNNQEDDEEDETDTAVHAAAPAVAVTSPAVAAHKVDISQPAIFSAPVTVAPVTTAPTAPTAPETVEAAGAGEGETQGNFTIDRTGEISTVVTEQLPRIDVRMDPPEGLPKYVFPPLDLLGDHQSGRQEVSDEELTRNNNKIRASLANYGIDVVDVRAIPGPTVTLYKVFPAPGVKISAIKNRQEDIAMSLHSRGVRIVTLPDAVGIEVANDNPSTVPLRGLLNDDAFRNTKAELPVAIGCNIQKDVRVFDLADAPHLLVAGATKQGKSVGLNVLIASLLYAKHPSELKLVFIDPKMVEFTPYGKLIHHYLAVLPDACSEEDEMDRAIVTKPKEAERILKSLCLEMDQRYELLRKAEVNNIKLYNDKYRNRHLLPTDGHKFLPYIVVIVDEYADLAMSGGSGAEGRNMKKNIMDAIVRLAQKGRAAGIHAVIATQRPSVDVITGLIKANFPARIAFRVTTSIDSKTILDAGGAEKLIGRGDMLYYAGVESERIQCGYISNDEINALSRFIGAQQGFGKSYNIPYYLPEPEPAEGGGEGGGMIDMKDLDERFEEAARMVVMTQRGSTSDIQRKLGMGYAKAGRVMDQLEAAGIVGPQEGSKPRQVLVGSLDELDEILKPFLR